MTKSMTTLAFVAVVTVGLGSAAWAQESDVGKFEYQISCATCHGNDGKGKGPFSTQLKSAPSDLTVLAKRNNGVFPFSSTYEIIDGRKAVSAHGTREMPIWGDRYIARQLPQSLQQYSPYNPEYVERARILAIIDYLNRIQEK